MANILALDDVLDAGTLIQRILERKGHRVFVFTGEERAEATVVIQNGEIEVRHGGKTLTANYQFKRFRKGYDLIMTVRRNTGWTKQNHRPTGGGRIENIPTPWGKQKRHYRFQSDGYVER